MNAARIDRIESQAIAFVIYQWDKNEPKPPAADPDDALVQELYRVACTCGC